MRRKSISERQKLIITMIVKHDKEYITVAEIAGKLALSNRTVQRDMDRIQSWFDVNDFKLETKPGKGISVKEDEINKKFILELLELENIDRSFSKEERVAVLKLKLLQSTDAIKLYYFTSVFNVSEGTLNNDIDEVEMWFSKFGIKLHRRKGKGIFIEGREKDIREAQIELIYESFKNDEILDSIKDISEIKVEDEKIFNLIDAETIMVVKNALIELVNEGSLIKVADNAAIALIVHISLAVERLKKGDKISMNENVLNSLKSSDEYRTAEKIAEKISEIKEIEIPESEVAYVTMHLQGAKLRETRDLNVYEIDDLDLDYVLNKFLMNASDVFEIDLSNDERLYRDLKNHLIPAISRIRNDMQIRNPILQDIKIKYSEVYRNVFDISKVFKNYFNGKEMPEAEIGFIAMHVGAAIERAKEIKDYSHIRTVVACPTGIGTSRFLSAKLEKAYKGIDILSTISILDLDEESLEREGVGFIISTADVKTDYRCVVVSPFLSQEDMRKINGMIDKVSAEKRKEKYRKDNMYSAKTDSKVYEEDVREDNYDIKNTFLNNKDIEKRNHNSDETIKKKVNSIELVIKDARAHLNIYDSFRVYSADAENPDNLIDIIIKNAELDYIEGKNIREDLVNRLKINIPYLEEAKLLVLHCKSASLDRSVLTCTMLKNPVEFSDGVQKCSVETVLMMGIAEKEYSSLKDTMSSICFNIVDDENVLESFKEKNEEKIDIFVKEMIAAAMAK